MMTRFEERLTARQHEIWTGLASPPAIQAYLDSIDYVGGALNRSPLRVLEEGQAHCLDGGMFAQLAPIDQRSYQAGMLGTNLDGLYQPH